MKITPTNFFLLAGGYKCQNQTLQGQKGVIYSPNYPEIYPDGQYCMWWIMVKASFQVALIFTRFSLQSENNTDAVYVYDGNDQTGNVLGVFYGGQPPPRNGIYSSSNSLLVIFRSDRNGSFYGFQASYNAVKCFGKSLLIDSITKLFSAISEFEMYLKILEDKILIHSHILRIHNAKNKNGSFYGFQASYSAV